MWGSDPSGSRESHRWRWVKRSWVNKASRKRVWPSVSTTASSISSLCSAAPPTSFSASSQRAIHSIWWRKTRASSARETKPRVGRAMLQGSGNGGGGRFGGDGGRFRGDASGGTLPGVERL